jgi:hypothetical protein
VEASDDGYGRWKQIDHVEGVAAWYNGHGVVAILTYEPVGSDLRHVLTLEAQDHSPTVSELRAAWDAILPAAPSTPICVVPFVDTQANMRGLIETTDIEVSALYDAAVRLAADTPLRVAGDGDGLRVRSR